MSNPTDDWLNVDMLELSWNPRALTWRTIEAIDIHLYGYKETGTSGSVSVDGFGFITVNLSKMFTELV